MCLGPLESLSGGTERFLSLPEAIRKANLGLTPCCSAVTLLPKSPCQGTKELWLACSPIVVVSPPRPAHLPVSPVRLQLWLVCPHTVCCPLPLSPVRLLVLIYI